MNLEENEYPPGAVSDALACLERSMQPWQRLPLIGKLIGLVGAAWRWAKGLVTGERF